MVHLFEKQKRYFQTGETRPIDFRLQQLKNLKAAIKKYEREIIDTLKVELHKSEFEAYSAEIGVVYEEIRFMMKRLPDWIKPQRVPTPLTHIGSKSYIYPEPYGVNLIIAPWNYPFQLAISPLVGAIAAGNCAIIKPSEYTPNMSALLKKMISETFPEEYIAVVEGGVEVSQQLLDLRFDHIFFTGSVPVGKIVMAAAAKHLTPVTLELGGKSPAIVDVSAHLDLAAKRIVWGKFLNAGQTCIAPDYVLVDANVKSLLIEKMKQYIVEFYGERPEQSPHYGRIVSERHTERLVRFLNEGTIVHGGRYDIEQRWIEPTLLDEITWEDDVMREEIFGPILPILTFETIDEAIAMVNAYEKPLALYLFSEDRQVQQQVIEQISFGGGCINDTIMHIATPYLPFGGVGQSGMGAYHGKASFDAFSHYKSVLKQTTKFDLSIRYPNNPNALKWIRKLFK
ncbi:aldehyde dehydrogenase [Thermolongibacillus altinsuensis]|uniref:aldehyde dehydrogenase n=1 Tax=Thermolongibacillus altinsuensis TaxID=575256 RepID=UPI00242A32F1|nr:aldehyde dehydrogenase [Thermolongibacillus altinsuensis]GMB08053.1 putative aldehyde dehydrogenase YwdH [Thermolongibacillus altinsuensis]